MVFASSIQESSPSALAWDLVVAGGALVLSIPCLSERFTARKNPRRRLRSSATLLTAGPAGQICTICRNSAYDDDRLCERKIVRDRKVDLGHVIFGRDRLKSP